MRDFLEMAGVLLLALLGLVVALALPLLFVAFYGAIFGALGAGAYAAFMWLVRLLGV